ncbi:hypothetical protein [Microbacterium sp. BK668]|uniref:hypothetical protein n=1 Tax=Microbacterium sp. BK668 TaxID=2512118 RepID=UPI00105E7F3C|nr:hypothetical protein [Microbacterium sp. BK668]
MTEAIVAFTGYGTSKRPSDDREAVALLEQVRGVPLLAALDSVLADAESVDLSDVVIPSDTAGEVYRSRLHEARPDLSDTALAALSNRWFYRRLWLGLPAPVERPRVQYFARFSTENGARVPWALYRREDDGKAVVDSVLKDVGTWREDRNRVVWSSLTNALETDIEPISARQAAEFEQMVAKRSYHPFTAP